MVNNKICKQCGETYPPSTHFFHRYHKGKHGLMPCCKQCRNKERGFSEHIPDGYKKCPGCKQVLEITTYFHRDTSSKDGRQSNCKACAYKKQNTPELKAKKAIYAKAREQATGYQRAYRQTEKYREAERRRNKTQKAIERRNRYYKSDKGRAAIKARNASRRSRGRNLPNRYAHEDWQRALEYFHGCCAVCGRQLNDLFGERTASIDHWIPLASPECPGTIPANIVPLCNGIDGCNTSKHSRNAVEWLVWKFGKRRANEINRRIQEYFEFVRMNDELVK